MKDELLDFRDSIPIRWRAFKKLLSSNGLKPIDAIYLLVLGFTGLLLVLNATNWWLIGIYGFVHTLGLIRYTWMAIK